MSQSRERLLPIAGLLGFVALALLVILFFPSVIGLSVEIELARPFEQQPGFIWDYRGIDVLVQGFIVVAATVAIAAIFREGTRPGSAERTVEDNPQSSLSEEEEEEI
ncbi:MAG: hypothetical protein LUP94_03715 [Candidatus Methanomethylicus sp.]|nr:hypothetical protein [Candidatus Methanomethylicus sp.]